MGPDLRASDVHLQMAAHKLPKGAPLQQRFECKRCHRNLPEGEFAPLWRISRGSVICLHPLCHTCRRHAKSEWAGSPLVTPRLQRFIDVLMSRTKAGARSRGIVVAIDADDVLGMYVQQEGRCALTGCEMTVPEKGMRTRTKTGVSIDRIYSNRNYTLDNVHLVCAVVNMMKNDMPLEEFGEWCKRVVLFALSAEDEEAA